MSNADSARTEKPSPGWLLIACAAGLGFYIFSPVLIVLVLVEPASSVPTHFLTFITILLAPLAFLYEHVPFVTAFYDWLLEPFLQP
ncbi:MAG: hypothetical protein ACFCU3_06165 [Verrucomicrobiales bacterium]